MGDGKREKEMERGEEKGGKKGGGKRETEPVQCLIKLMLSTQSCSHFIFLGCN